MGGDQSGWRTLKDGGAERSVQVSVGVVASIFVLRSTYVRFI